MIVMSSVDDWGVNGKKTFVFLVASLLIALCIILLLVIAFVINICARSFTNHQPGTLCDYLFTTFCRVQHFVNTLFIGTTCHDNRSQAHPLPSVQNG